MTVFLFILSFRAVFTTKTISPLLAFITNLSLKNLLFQKKYLLLFLDGHAIFKHEEMGKKAVSHLIYFIEILVTLTISIITIIGAFSSHADPNHYPIIAYIGLVLPGLLLLSLLLAFYWGIRKKVWIVLPFLAILANFEYVNSVVHFSTKKEVTGKTLKIATYNIHSFNKESTGFSAKQIARYMEKEKIDVLCFQEFNGNNKFPNDSLLQVYKNYPYRYIPHLPGRDTRIAIFSKYPLIDSLFIPFPKSINCGMWADILVEGKRIRIFNVHMQTTALNQNQYKMKKEQVYYTDEEKIQAMEELNISLIHNMQIRARQAQLMRSLMDTTSYPMLLCGDFNDTPASYVYNQLKGPLSDGFKTCGNGYQYTFRKLQKLLRIDFIFHSPELKGLQYESPSLPWSDHNPVIMKIEL